MSIYATTVMIDDDEHDPGCAQLVAVPGTAAMLTLDPAQPCTCAAGPIAYQGSHILPADTDPRAGTFDLGAIPGFITGLDRPALHDGDGEDWPYHPWLRVSVNAETVVLDRRQVERVREELDRWLTALDQ
jgi:hypothetical protein